MRTFAALLFLIIGCSKHSQHELDQAGHDLNRAAHHTAEAVTSSAADDAEALARELHDVDAKLRGESDRAAHAVGDTARKTASDTVAALQRERDELEAKLSAARASQRAGDTSGSSTKTSP
jgi:hypothetical protein